MESGPQRVYEFTYLKTVCHRLLQDVLVPDLLGGLSGVPLVDEDGALVGARLQHYRRSGHEHQILFPVPGGRVARLYLSLPRPAALTQKKPKSKAGRTQRLVTPPIRAALELRDGGCVFPGCDKPPEACHARPTWPTGRAGQWHSR